MIILKYIPITINNQLSPRGKLAFKHGAAFDLHLVTKEFKIEILTAKQHYTVELKNKIKGCK